MSTVAIPNSTMMSRCIIRSAHTSINSAVNTPASIQQSTSRPENPHPTSPPRPPFPLSVMTMPQFATAQLSAAWRGNEGAWEHCLLLSLFAIVQVLFWLHAHTTASRMSCYFITMILSQPHQQPSQSRKGSHQSKHSWRADRLKFGKGGPRAVPSSAQGTTCLGSALDMVYPGSAPSGAHFQKCISLYICLRCVLIIQETYFVSVFPV